jgi:hypothetical protein
MGDLRWPKRIEDEIGVRLVIDRQWGTIPAAIVYTIFFSSQPD